MKITEKNPYCKLKIHECTKKCCEDFGRCRVKVEKKLPCGHIEKIKCYKAYFTDINTALRLIYEDSPFYNFTEEITCKHQIIKSEFEEMNKKLNNTLAKTTEWNIIFNSAKEQIKIREEKRKVYDHYESKISKINKNSNKKDLKFIERNESKFSKAASEYVDISEKTYNIINNSLKLTWGLTTIKNE